VINSRDQLGSLKQRVEWLLHAGCANVSILDNASTYSPLLEYLGSNPSGVRVVRLEQNLGPHSMWKPGVHARLGIEGPFVFTDPDVLCHLHDVLLSRPGCGTVGLGLKTDDLPDCYRWKEQVISWESQFTRRQVGKGLCYAPIDTTFALHGTYSKPPQRGLRTGYPYLARHLALVCGQPTSDGGSHLLRAARRPRREPLGTQSPAVRPVAAGARLRVSATPAAARQTPLVRRR
jgi:hypothetical protein